MLVALDRQERGQGELSAIQSSKIRNSCACTDYHERFNGLFRSERRKEALANMQAYREKYGI